MESQYCVCRADRVHGDGGGLGTEILRMNSDGTKYSAPNIDASRTHLNKSFVDLDGIGGNAIKKAINDRIANAGINRKVTDNQCRALVVYLSGTHDQMMELEEQGRIGEWAEESLQWLKDTFGEDNVVVCEMHRDEFTPHIHAVVVPITKEARVRKKREGDPKRNIKPKTRLCADHYMKKRCMRGWQDTYAERMAKFGLQRGVKGSGNRHQSMNEYYKNLKEKKIPEAEMQLMLLNDAKSEREYDLEKTSNDVKIKKEELDSVEHELADKSAEKEFLDNIIAERHDTSDQLLDEINVRKSEIEKADEIRDDIFSRLSKRTQTSIDAFKIENERKVKIAEERAKKAEKRAEKALSDLKAEKEEHKKTKRKLEKALADTSQAELSAQLAKTKNDLKASKSRETKAINDKAKTEDELRKRDFEIKDLRYLIDICAEYNLPSKIISPLIDGKEVETEGIDGKPRRLKFDRRQYANAISLPSLKVYIKERWEDFKAWYAKVADKLKRDAKSVVRQNIKSNDMKMS